MEHFEEFVDLFITNALTNCCLYRSPNVTPNTATVTNLLWVIASVETTGDKISLRPYHYDMNPEELKALANQVLSWCKEMDLPINGYLLNAYLAVMTNHNFVSEAELIFEEMLPKYGQPTSHSFELMLKLYDSTGNFQGTQKLIEQSRQSGLGLSFEAWRAAIRSAASTTHLKESIDYLRAMVNAGHKPSLEDLKLLHLRLCENEKWELRKQMGDLCLIPPETANNPYTSWRKRSILLHHLLQDVYGKDAPELATKLDKGLRLDS